MMEETGNFSSDCPGLYTQIFRGWAGSWSIAYTVYSIFQGPGRFLVPSVYRRLENPGPWAKSVYSKIQGPGQVPGLERIQDARKAWARAEPVYSKIQSPRSPSRFLVNSVYRKPEEPGSGQNLYTQKFRAQVRSWLLAYTESSKSLDSGRICILKNSGPGQAPGSERIQTSSKIQGPGRICILKNSGPGQVPGCWRIQTSSKSQGPGRNLYTQKFRARAGS